MLSPEHFLEIARVVDNASPKKGTVLRSADSVGFDKKVELSGTAEDQEEPFQFAKMDVWKLELSRLVRLS